MHIEGSSRVHTRQHIHILQRRTSIPITTLALLLVLSSAPGVAQDAAPPDTTGPAVRDSLAALELEPLVVEAMHLRVPAERLPYAGEVLSGPELDLAGSTAQGLEDVLHGVAGLQADNRFNAALGDRLSVRGFGARASFGVRGVQVLIDGIPATLADGQTDLSRLDLAAVDRVEVLRGPASSVYGNAAGGVVRFRTRPPPPVPFAQEFEVLGGSGELWQGRARIAGTGAGAAYEATVARRTNDGFREFARSDRWDGSLAGRLQLGGGELTTRASFVEYDARNPGSLSTEQLERDRGQAHPGNVAQVTGENARQGLLALSWAQPLADGGLEVTGFGLVRRLENPIPPTIIDLDRTAGGLRALFRSGVAGARGVRWAVGTEFDVQHDDRLNHENAGGDRGALTLSQVETVLSLAAFSQLLVPIGDRLDVMAGARYDRFRFRVEDRLSSGDPDDSGTRWMGAFSPSVGVNARIADPLHVYANVASSFETPTTTELANRPSGAGGFNPELEPQRALSFEAGLKGALDLFAYGLAAYRTGVEDALVPFEVPDAPGRQFFRNAGQLTHRGVEAELELAWPASLRWRTAYTYTDARFDEFVVDGESFEDNRVPGVAPHRLEGSVALRHPAGLVMLRATHSADVPVNDANTPETEAPAYTVLSARAEWHVGHAGPLNLTLLAAMENLTDADYISSVTVNAFGGRYYEPGAPRSLLLGVRTRLVP